ncbi:MAG TPA: hypothetical protein VG452_13735 [Egibacteraceae bacterium]|nr:hypothetical protein [Actinomycetota bacterium]HWB73269.1 hypothetical protein [Egibacteraceae bacterium]
MAQERSGVRPTPVGWRASVPGSGARKAKISVTVDEELWAEVQTLVDEQDAAASASAAVEQALSLWVANQRLAHALEALYAQDPASRPTDDEVARAAEALGL